MEDTPRILIIDDEEVVLDSCAQILEGGDCSVATATDGATGLRLVEEFRPDLVFVDLKMPGMSGFEALGRIQASDPTVVTVVITGYATVSSAVEAMKKGAYDFLPKPFTPDELRLVARRGLEKRRLALETIALRREKEMLREHFAAVVSHELKAPLNAVQQNLFALSQELSDRLTEGQRGRFERMRSRVDDLLRLIQTWLRGISADVGKIREGFRPVSVASVMSRAVETVQPHATRKDVETVVSAEAPLSLVEGDEGTLTESLVNLLENAVKYSHVGGKVRVHVEEREERVLISVSDTGVGIPREDLPFIFGDFYTGKGSQAAERGHGLGLAISRRIVEAHHGTLSAESEPGRGSTFLICLPALKAGLRDRPPGETAVPADLQKGGATG